MIKLGLEKAEELQIKLPTSTGSSKKQESSGKASTSALFTMTKPLTVWITTNCGKLLKRWEYQTTWPASWEICMQVKKQQLELDMKQQTWSKSWKQYVKAVYWHPALFNFYAEYIMRGEGNCNPLQYSCLENPMDREASRPWSMGSQRVGHHWSDWVRTSCKMQGWMKHKLESRLPGEISITSDMQMTPPYGRKWRTKKPLDENEREWKSWLKAQHSEN